ncbi:Probable receptor-like protein kinase [Striga hermonthica]|uniref:Probable receptor-like protein kinase n=1 Tax=Striga hermonthica TaxID=68872 RepID=A0A9N7N249_STRHE|nr:Probable receptor-like protein kinase [Striga hermonthica]
MENKRANLIALSIIILLIILLIIARLTLGPSKTFFLICGADVAAILSVLAVAVLRAHFRARRARLERQLDSQGRELRVEYSFLRKVAGVPARFRLRELEEATDGFRAIIGRGGSGSVFRGILADGTPVAVKRIDDNGDRERGDRTFKSEVSALASVQHINLVRLLGYCTSGPSSSGGPRFLVYEFIHNGSLDNWIFPESGKKNGPNNSNRRSGCLSWESRRGVALDVARALSYLHHDCRSCVLHLDVKPENILIDEGYRALVSDFGLSRLKGREESRVVTGVRGTRGYLAPEWLSGGGASEKCDVYGFGMVVLEMIGGRRNIRETGRVEGSLRKRFEFFPRVVVEKMKEGKLMEVVDMRLLEGGARIDEGELRRMVCVALWCIQDEAKARPSMARVVEMLEGRAPVEEPPETRMLIVDLLSVEDDDGNDVGGDRKRVGGRVRPVFVRADGESVPSMPAYSYAFSSVSGR